jgi:hypothetical protein
MGCIYAIPHRCNYCGASWALDYSDYICTSGLVHLQRKNILVAM